MLSFYKMKRTLFLFFFSLFFTFNAFGQDIATAPYLPAQSAQTSSSAPITVQYPHEKMTVSRGAKKIFIFGKLNLKIKLQKLYMLETQRRIVNQQI